MKERGSAQMLRKRGGTIQDADFALVEELSAIDGVDLIRWWWKGQPAPDVIWGRFEIRELERAGDIVSRLIQAEAIGGLKVFPKGTPVIEGVIVEFGTEIG